MEISHPALLRALQIAEPALSARPLLPALQLLWFTGTAVRATDGFIGIEVPCETEFKGGVPGKVLLGFLSSMKRKIVKITEKDNWLVFSAGRSRISLPLNTTDHGVWQFDDETGEDVPHLAELSLAEEWREALSFTLVSVTNNTTHDERRGVTLLDEGGKLNLYTTDGATIAWAAMPPIDGKWGAERFTMPGDFVREVMRTSAVPADKDNDTLVIYDKMVRACLSGGVKISALFLDVPEPTDFRKVIHRLGHNMEPILIPEVFGPALERAALLKDDKDGVLATLTFGEENQFRIEAKSSFGELKERLRHEGEHNEITFKVLPGDVLRALEGRTRMIASKRCLTLTGPENFTYIVAASS